MARRYELSDASWELIKDLVSPEQKMGRPRNDDFLIKIICKSISLYTDFIEKHFATFPMLLKSRHPSHFGKCMILGCCHYQHARDLRHGRTS